VGDESFPGLSTESLCRGEVSSSGGDVALEPEEAELGPGFGEAAVQRLVRFQLIGGFVEAAGGDQVAPGR
jgi:hypothetical protein